MTKSYKLIKEYPGSPKLGTIARDCNKDGFKVSEDKYPIVRISCFLVQNQPEYWQEVSDYEILSIIGNNRENEGTILKDSANINAWLDGEGRRCWNIHSIKRKSDNEIFTIGDKVKYISNELSNIVSIIEKLSIDNNNIFTIFKDGRNTSYLTSDLKWLKVIDPILLTEDNVMLYNKDEYFLVRRSDSMRINTFSKMILNNAFKLNSSYLYFSTKEKADEYIFLNKTCLSYKDILDCRYSSGGISLNKITGLVKQKLNQ